MNSISIPEAIKIASELKAKRRIWFNPPMTEAQIANEVAKIHSERWRERHGKRSNKVSPCTNARVKHGKNTPVKRGN